MLSAHQGQLNLAISIVPAYKYSITACVPTQLKKLQNHLLQQNKKWNTNSQLQIKFHKKFTTYFWKISNLRPLLTQQSTKEGVENRYSYNGATNQP